MADEVSQGERTVNRCIRCGLPNDPRQDFCVNCGVALASETDRQLVADQIARGGRAAASVQELESRGYSRAAAEEFVAEVDRQARTRKAGILREWGTRSLVTGTVLALGGLFFTLFTYGAAASYGGGGYLIATGAIFGGTGAALAGLVAMLRARRLLRQTSG